MKWLNFGGGHHITRKDYDLEKLIKIINEIKEKYQVQGSTHNGGSYARVRYSLHDKSSERKILQ